jgi:tellurite resistance protein TehA-like permease
MKAYVMTTGVVFGLVTIAHVWRVIAEGAQLARDPWYVLVTVATAGLCLWAVRLVWRAGRSS